MLVTVLHKGLLAEVGFVTGIWQHNCEPVCLWYCSSLVYEPVFVVWTSYGNAQHQSRQIHPVYWGLHWVNTIRGEGCSGQLGARGAVRWRHHQGKISIYWPIISYHFNINKVQKRGSLLVSQLVLYIASRIAEHKIVATPLLHHTVMETHSWGSGVMGDIAFSFWHQELYSPLQFTSNTNLMESLFCNGSSSSHMILSSNDVPRDDNSFANGR